MNFAYRLLISVSEIIFAIGFVVIAKRIRINVAKIRIKSMEASGLERLVYAEEHSARQEALSLLITNGIYPSGGNEVAMSKKFGLIYPVNLSEQHEILHSKAATVKIFGNCAGQVQRQLLSCTPTAGLLLARLIDGDIEVLD